MHETPFPDVDPGMTDLGAAIGGEEDQVAGLQGILADVRRLHADHFPGRAWQRDTCSITIHIADQAAAIEPGVRSVATPAIRRTHQAQGAEQHVFGNR